MKNCPDSHHPKPGKIFTKGERLELAKTFWEVREFFEFNNIVFLKALDEHVVWVLKTGDRVHLKGLPCSVRRVAPKLKMLSLSVEVPETDKQEVRNRAQEPHQSIKIFVIGMLLDQQCSNGAQPLTSYISKDFARCRLAKWNRPLKPSQLVLSGFQGSIPTLEVTSLGAAQI